MENTRKKNSALIFFTGGMRQLTTLLANFISRTVFIVTLGADYLGLNSLFSGILAMLALSELGIGSAIAFRLYKPIANDNKKRILALLHFYKICYRCIGLFMIALGCALLPFLHLLVNFPEGLNVNLYIVFLLYVLNTATTYLLFAYKQTFALASQKQYVVERVNTLFIILGLLVDIVVLLIFRWYLAYLLARLAVTILKNLTMSHVLNKHHPILTEKTKETLLREEKISFFKDAANSAIFRVGSTLFNATDAIIISIVLGTINVGYYSNYQLIFSQTMVVINIIILSITAGVGDVIAKESKRKQTEVFRELDFAVYMVVSVFAICLFQCTNTFIALWLGHIDNAYVLPQVIVTLFCINFFFDGTTQVLNTFREGSGNFKVCRSLQLAGGIANIVLSVILGIAYGLPGIIAATVISKACITYIPFLVLVGKRVLGFASTTLVRSYFLRLIVVIFLGGTDWLLCSWLTDNSLLGLFLKIIISLLISIGGLAIIYHRNNQMKELRAKLRQHLVK